MAADQPADPARARLMRSQDARHYLWGDAVSSQVKDWYYAGSDQIHMAMFSLPPGGVWRHSDRHKSYYCADECYYLLAGELTIHNPETGDLAVVRAGDALTFRERTWHVRAGARGHLVGGRNGCRGAATRGDQAGPLGSHR